MGLNDFWTTQTLPLHILNNRIMPGVRDVHAGLDIKHLVYMPVGHLALKIYVPCKNFHVPSQYLYKPCKAYVYCWENKYMPRLKNHLPSRARKDQSLCALRQDLHAPGTRARLNVEPWHGNCNTVYRLKTLPVEWLTWHKCHYWKNKILLLDHFAFITAGMTF